MALRAADWPSDPLLGTTHYTVGLINGGVAPNVIPPNAEAEVFFRTVGEHAPLREMLHQALAGRVEVEEILELPAVRMHTVPGFETAVFSYFSDIPFLTNWGTPLLLGPGIDPRRPHRSRAPRDRRAAIAPSISTRQLAATLARRRRSRFGDHDALERVDQRGLRSGDRIPRACTCDRDADRARRRDTGDRW